MSKDTLIKAAKLLAPGLRHLRKTARLQEGEWAELKLHFRVTKDAIDLSNIRVERTKK